nr:hypothetical protein [Tanacetum cinerariifolium]
MHIIEQPILSAPAADSAVNMLAEWNAVNDAHNEVACLMLESMTSELHKQFKNYSPYEMLQKLRSMFEKQAGVEGDLSVGLILNGPTSDFAGFVRSYNMRNMGKTIGELHALLIEYEKGLPKKAVTPQVMAIQGGRIQKANKKSQNAKGKGKGKGKRKDKSYILKPKHLKPNAKEHPTKNDACHHCKEGLRGARKLKQGDLYLYVGNEVRAQVEAIGSFDLVLPNGLVICLDNLSRNNVLYFNAIPSNGIYEIDMSNPVPKVNSIYNVSNKKVKHNLDSTYLWHCRLAHISKKHIEKLQQDGLLKSMDDESFDQCVSCLSRKMTRKSFLHCPERATDVLGLIHTDVCGPLRHVSRQEAAARILNMVPTKKVDKTSYELWFGKVPNLSYLKVWGCEEMMGCYFYFSPENKIVVARYAEFFEKNLLSQEVSGRARDLEEIQDEDTSPSKITSEIPMEVEGFEPPQEEEAPVYRSERPHRAPNSLCLNVEVEEHSLGDLNEPANYKAAMLDSESNKWLDAMNVEMQSMKDNQVWRLVDLIAIAVFYDYEIWQIDVKTAFLNDYLDEDIYMVQPGGFIDPKHAHKNLGETAFILGIKIYRDRSRRLIGLCQSAYMDKILKRCRMDYSKRGYIPMQERLDLNKTQGASTPKENPGELHWTDVKTILKYLRNTKDMFLVYGGNPKAELRVECYCDAEAEYIAASEAGMEAVWIRKFISGLGIVPTINEPIRMFCDNSTALHFANEPGVQKGARHFHRKYHYVCECIKLGEIKFLKVHTDDNLADPFAKALSNKKLSQHAKIMGLHLASSFL